MAHFYIYCDESGKLAQSDITSFCGFVSHATECERVMIEWDNCRLGWDAPPIHMRCIMFPERDNSGEWQKKKDEWGSLWERKRDAMLSDFGSILQNSHMAAVGCCMDAKHFRSMPDTECKKSIKDPLF
jgi:hypothetical protein